MEEKNRKYRIYKIIMLVIITAFITFMITSISLYSYFSNGASVGTTSIFSSNDNTKLLSAFSKYDQIIEKYFLGNVDKEKMQEEAIRGYIKGLDDPYTEYISKEEMQEYEEDILGNFVGIGIYMVQDTETDRIAVLSPIKNSPAEKAGIKAGDLIIKVDGVEYKAEDMSEVSSKIKGKQGSTVNLEILRGEKTLNFNVNRENIVTNPVTSKVIENNIGYIELPSFDENTSTQFKEQWENLQKQNIQSLIIDLRNNGGGIVDEAITIANYIADKDSTLLITKDKHGNEDITKANENPIINVPVVILINENTASSAEILAGALKDLQKATLVGTKTYGKGVIQDFLTLNDGSGIKITSQEYYTPNHSKINEIGIEPNEKVELPESVENPLLVDQKQDTQLQKAIQIVKNN